MQKATTHGLTPPAKARGMKTITRMTVTITEGMKTLKANVRAVRKKRKSAKLSLI